MSLTMTIVITAVVGFGLTAILGLMLLPMLRKLKFGQTIKEIGPSWHKDKEGTPTMGGIMFIIGIIVAAIVGFIFLRQTAEYGVAMQMNTAVDLSFWAGIAFAFLMGLIGFVDDYIKVVKKRNLGLSAKQKTIFQFIVIIGYMVALYFSGALSSTDLVIPFTNASLPLWYFYYPIMAIAIYYIVNAVNITDGVDGLATSVTFVVGVGYMVVSYILQSTQYVVLSTALAAGCLGFIIYNAHPAKLFMGDTGSMFLGGIFVAIGMGTNQPLLMIVIGIVYIIEALSVVLQVISFKLFGKRIFKMSPIHHHFEMSDWSETKIVLVFSGVTVVGAILTIISAYNYLGLNNF